MKPRKTLRPRDQFLRKIWLVMEIELTMMRAKRCLFKMLKLKDCQKIDFEGSVLSYATQAIPMKKKVTSKIRKI